jgi:hypothetical protein
MGIIWLNFINVYTYLNIIYAQPKVPKVCANTCNAKISLYFNLEANNP